MEGVVEGEVCFCWRGEKVVVMLDDGAGELGVGVDEAVDEEDGSGDVWGAGEAEDEAEGGVGVWAAGVGEEDVVGAG